MTDAETNDQASEVQTQPAPPERPSVAFRPLRIWPVILLLIAMVTLWIFPRFLESPPIEVMMIAFMGPLGVSTLIVLWWLFFSRASWTEKGIGLLGLVALVVLTSLVADKSVQGFALMMLVIPWGFTGFAAATIGLSRVAPPARVLVTLGVTLCFFGYWNLIRIDEFKGDFEMTRNWRWVPTNEDLFMEELAERKKGAVGDVEAASSALADPEWPAFRGADRSGMQPGVVLSEDWDANAPKELWRMRVGPGWSSFSVAGELLFTQEQRDDEEVVVCYDATNGAEIWNYAYESRFWEAIGGVGPRATPTLQDGNLFALGAAGILNRLDPLTGDKVWSRDLREDADREPPTWGFASSPLVTNGVVIVHAGGAGDKGLLAYDIETGELKWGAPSGDHSYSSPQMADIVGRDCVLMLTNAGLELFDAEAGEAVGTHEWEYTGYRVVQPLVLEEGNVLLGSPMGTGTQRVSIDFDTGEMASKTNWISRRMNPYYNDYVVHEGYLYGFDNSIFACIELENGDLMWKGGRYGNGQVLLLPDGNQLLVISEDGELVLLRTNPQQHEELTRFQALEGRTWNHPVLIGNRLYVRNGEEAACFEMPLKDEGSTAAP